MDGQKVDYYQQPHYTMRYRWLFIMIRYCRIDRTSHNFVIPVENPHLRTSGIAHRKSEISFGRIAEISDVEHVYFFSTGPPIWTDFRFPIFVNSSKNEPGIGIKNWRFRCFAKNRKIGNSKLGNFGCFAKNPCKIGIPIPIFPITSKNALICLFFAVHSCILIN